MEDARQKSYCSDSWSTATVHLTCNRSDLKNTETGDLHVGSDGLECPKMQTDPVQKSTDSEHC